MVAGKSENQVIVKSTIELMYQIGMATPRIMVK